jgi:hypothetical protein
MTGALVVLGIAMLAAAPPLVLATLRGVASGSRPAMPLAVIAAATAVLVAGVRRFAASWPGTGGHPWRHHALVPSGPASWAWSATRGITTYWLHPRELGRFSAAEVAWMAISPLAFAALGVAVAVLLRRLELGPRTLRYLAGVTRVAVGAFGVLLVGVACWVLAGVAPGPTDIYRVGLVERLGLLAMVGLLGVAVQASRPVRNAASLR